MTQTTTPYFHTFRHAGTTNPLLKQQKAAKKPLKRLFSGQINAQQKNVLYMYGRTFTEAQPFTKRTHDHVLISICEKSGI